MNREELGKRLEKLRVELRMDGYSERVVSLSEMSASWASFWTAGPLVAALVLLYWYFLDPPSLLPDGFKQALILLFAFLLCQPVHEQVHAFVWRRFSREPESVICGGMRESAKAYCHCTEALPYGGYLLGLLAPSLVLGLLPAALGFLLRSNFLLWIGASNLLAMGEDLTLALRLLRHRAELVANDPVQCGFVAFSHEKA